jgi:hypothetical protein
MKIDVTCWKWGGLFDAMHVNVLRAALDRHLQHPHALTCITDDPTGIDGDVRIVPMPTEFASAPRCRRRMQGFDRDFSAALGARILYIDLDVVLVGDITSLVNRPEAVIGFRVQHANVISGSFLLANSGALHGAWEPFARDPEGYPRRVQANGVPSDQAMLNHYFARNGLPVHWTTRDGFVTFYGKGYERQEQADPRGVGVTRKQLPPGAKVVVLGSQDLWALEGDAYPWAAEHWQALAWRTLQRRAS